MKNEIYVAKAMCNKEECISANYKRNFMQLKTGTQIDYLKVL